jgi:prepilin-type processing-associated H-X9-DG protein/prepilin-type N-terminal cleavage/methylation domain-containing protein
MNARRPSRSWAFTLVELLVVISILAVLLGLLLPGLTRARNEAHAAACAAKLRQIGTGLIQYVTDTKFYPVSDYRDPSGGGFASETWCEMIYPYITGEQPPTNPNLVSDLFTDPGVREKFGNFNRRFALTYPINSSRTGGIAPITLNGMTRAQMDALRIPIANVPEPSRTFAVVDGRRSPYTFLEANTHFVRDTWEINLRPHDGLNNWLFCDGHVERILVEDTIGSNGLPNAPRGIWTRAAGD